MTAKSVAERTVSGRHAPGIVRQMGIGDLDRVMEIEQKSFIAPWSKGMFEETIFSPLSRGFVIEQDNSIGGYSVFYIVDVEAI
jgi:ribosomal protein S18 acetylase RimI-like enzyme